MLPLLKEISFVRLIIPFCLGIVGYVFLPVKPGIAVAAAIFFACFLLLFLYQNIHAVQRSYPFRWMGGIFIFAVFILAGYVLTFVKTEINSSRHFSRFVRSDSKVLLQISEPLVERAKSFKTTARAIMVVNSDSAANVMGTVLVYLKKDSVAARLKYGDRIWVKGRFAPLPPPVNPGEFNYSRFMGFKQVYRQIFLSAGDWFLAQQKGGCRLYALLLDLRHLLLNILREHIDDEDSYAVGSSLILGMREKLDDELIKAYSSSGAMHVLAVSGLHVAILYTVFNTLLFFLDRNSKSKAAKSFINVTLIWVYAVLTGLSASVLRAAVMFTFVAMGNNLKRHANIYNNLACSAFFLLLINPYFLMEVGFQLSYLAVLGIVMLQPRLYALLYFRNWMLDKIWMITAVSIAAQVATFPLGLLYYYQFPVYFLISNLFVIPASTLILYLGVALFVLCWIPVAGAIAGFLLDKTIWLMNQVVFHIESLPFALLQGISISVPESWFIYAIVSGLVVFFYYNRNSFLITSLGALTLLIGWNAAEKILNMQQRKLIVYSVPKTTAIDFICGTDHVFIADSALLHDHDRMLFHIKHNWWDSGLRPAAACVSDNFETAFLKRENRYIQFLHRRIILLDEDFKPAEMKEKLKVDWVIVSKNPKINVSELAQALDFRQLIFDSSNSEKNLRRWKKECRKAGIACYDVNEQGAFVESI